MRRFLENLRFNEFGENKINNYVTVKKKSINYIQISKGYKGLFI